MSAPNIALSDNGMIETTNAVSITSASVRISIPDVPQGRCILNDVSLDVKKSELLVIVGHSGCGKTTVLNLLAGLMKPTSGSLTINGKSVASARSEIAYMFARDALLPWRTALRNVEFGLEIRRPDLTRKERKKISQNYLDLLGVGNSAKHLPSQLSHGMRQRVAIARTWAVEPKVLLMDEPFAALDAQTRRKAQEEFLNLWSTHKRTVIFVTHDLAEALVLADRIIVMDQGRIVDEVPVTLERPRQAEMIVENDEYRRLYKRLSDALKQGEQQ